MRGGGRNAPHRHLGIGDPPIIDDREGAGKPAQDALEKAIPRHPDMGRGALRPPLGTLEKVTPPIVQQGEGGEMPPSGHLGKGDPPR